MKITQERINKLWAHMNTMTSIGIKSSAIREIIAHAELLERNVNKDYSIRIGSAKNVENKTLV